MEKSLIKKTSLIFRKPLTNNDSFDLSFNPVVSLLTGEFHSLEVTVKKNTTEIKNQELVLPKSLPSKFSNKALLTELVLLKIMLIWNAWRIEGEIFFLRINLDIESILCGKFPNLLSSLMLKFSIDHSHFILEIPEIVFIEISLTELANLEKLVSMGFKLAIKNFGDNYSYMEFFNRNLFFELKMDAAYVVDAAYCSAAKKILQENVLISKQLKLMSTASGVETLLEWNLLKEFGYDLAQGDFISEEIPFHAVLPTMNRWTKTYQAISAPSTLST
jgi:EAL domain-containing protein (putative c-di-GMP-specific phosphodiesterase class I)